MVQTYGIARENEVDVAGHGTSAETSALLGRGSQTVGEEKPDGHATLGSCISNLSNTIMGTGVYTFLPHSENMAKTGCSNRHAHIPNGKCHLPVQFAFDGKLT